MTQKSRNEGHHRKKVGGSVCSNVIRVGEKCEMRGGAVAAFDYGGHRDPFVTGRGSSATVGFCSHEASWEQKC